MIATDLKICILFYNFTMKLRSYDPPTDPRCDSTRSHGGSH